MTNIGELLELKKMLIKTKKYNEIIELKHKLQQDPEWQLIESLELGGGKSTEDIDEVSTFYHEKMNRAVSITIKYHCESASIREIPVKNLNIDKKSGLKF